jgi:hypothetical protein
MLSRADDEAILSPSKRFMFYLCCLSTVVEEGEEIYPKNKFLAVSLRL